MSGLCCPKAALHASGSIDQYFIIAHGIFSTAINKHFQVLVLMHKPQFIFQNIREKYYIQENILEETT